MEATRESAMRAGDAKIAAILAEGATTEVTKAERSKQEEAKTTAKEADTKVRAKAVTKAERPKQEE